MTTIATIAIISLILALKWDKIKPLLKRQAKKCIDEHKDFKCTTIKHPICAPCKKCEKIGFTDGMRRVMYQDSLRIDWICPTCDTPVYIPDGSITVLKEH
jgi:hypothetical protein